MMAERSARSREASSSRQRRDRGKRRHTGGASGGPRPSAQSVANPVEQWARDQIGTVVRINSRSMGGYVTATVEQYKLERGRVLFVAGYKNLADPSAKRFKELDKVQLLDAQRRHLEFDHDGSHSRAAQLEQNRAVLLEHTVQMLEWQVAQLEHTVHSPKRFVAAGVGPAGASPPEGMPPGASASPTSSETEMHFETQEGAEAINFFSMHGDLVGPQSLQGARPALEMIDTRRIGKSRPSSPMSPAPLGDLAYTHGRAPHDVVQRSGPLRSVSPPRRLQSGRMMTADSWGERSMAQTSFSSASQIGGRPEPPSSTAGYDLAKIEQALPVPSADAKSQPQRPEPEHDKPAMPETVSDWLDEVGLGDEADKARKQGRRELKYAEQLAKVHYDKLGYLLSADREEIEELLSELPLPHKRKIRAHWEASVEEIAHYRKVAVEYGIPQVELKKALAMEDPYALKKIVDARRRAARDSTLGQFLDIHGLLDYGASLFHCLGCKTLEHLTSTSEPELSVFADQVGMGLADRKRLLAAVNGEQSAAFLRRFIDHKLTPEECQGWIRKAVSTSEKELHEMVEDLGINEDKQRALKSSLDELRPCPAAAVVQALQERPVSVSELKQRAMAYVEKGHVDGSAVLQADTEGLIALIADGEKSKHRSEREHERRRVVEAAQAKALLEQSRKDLEKQAEQSRKDLEKQAGESTLKLERSMNEQLDGMKEVMKKGHAVKDDRFGVYHVVFSPPVPLPPDVKISCPVAAKAGSELRDAPLEILLRELGVHSVQLKPEPSSSALGAMAKTVVTQGANLLVKGAQTAAAGALAATGAGAAAAPVAGQAIGAAAEGALSAVGLNGESSKAYQVKVVTHQKCKLTLTIQTLTEQHNEETRFTLQCAKVKEVVTAAETLDVPQDPTCQVLLKEVARDREFDKQAWARGSDADDAPTTVSGWLDEINLGDESDKQRPNEHRLGYAESLAIAGYDDLTVLRDAEKEIERQVNSPELERVLEEIEMKEPHRRKFMKHWRALVSANSSSRYNTRDNEDISDWLDEIKLGDESDEQRDYRLGYARKLAIAGYDDLAVLRDAEKEIEETFDQVSSPELERVLKEIKMKEPHQRKFMKHWRALVSANSTYKDIARDNGISEVDIERAEASGDPNAMRDLVREKADDTDEKLRFMVSIKSINYHVPPGMRPTVTWDFEFQYRLYRRPDKSDLVLKLSKRYSQVKAFHDQLVKDVDSERLKQMEQSKQQRPVMPATVSSWLDEIQLGGERDRKHNKKDKLRYAEKLAGEGFDDLDHILFNVVKEHAGSDKVNSRELWDVLERIGMQEPHKNRFMKHWSRYVVKAEQYREHEYSRERIHPLPTDMQFPGEESANIFQGKGNKAFLQRREHAFSTYFQKLIKWEQSHDRAWLQILPHAQAFFSPRDAAAAGGGGGGDDSDAPGDLLQEATGAMDSLMSGPANLSQMTDTMASLMSGKLPGGTGGAGKMANDLMSVRLPGVEPEPQG